MAYGDSWKVESSKAFVDRFNPSAHPEWLQAWDTRIGRLEKALGTTEAGSVLLQPEVDKVIAHLVEFRNPLRQNLPRRPGSGQNWIVNRRTAGSTAAGWVADTASAPVDQGSYAQVSFPYQTLLVQGRVSRKLQATGKSYINILTEEMEAKAREFRDHEDQAIVQGDTDGDIFTADANQPDGLEVLISTSSQIVLQTSVAVGDSLSLAKMDELIDACSGNPDMLVMAKRSRRNLNALLQANQRFVNVVEVRGGFITLEYNGIPVFVSTNVPTDFDFDGTNHTAIGAGGSMSSIYAVDTEFFWVGELTPLGVTPVESGTTQYDLFEIFEDVTFVLSDTLRLAKLVGVDGT